MITMNTQGYSQGAQHAGGCCCPACTGLACLERPRYFAGQLLTEADLSSEQSYQLAKQRLHNRYLHGPGVVCGLNVVCHDCAGWIKILSGYAIDPCGNDIIVCADYSFNFIDAIKKCRNRQQRPRDCAPMVQNNPDCKDVEETWCVTIAYNETATRLTTPLRNGGPKSKTCACGGNCGQGCGCQSQTNGKSAAGQSGSGSGQSAQTGSYTSMSGGTMAACEPTRIQEGYLVDVVQNGCTTPTFRPTPTPGRYVLQNASPNVQNAVAWLQQGPQQTLLTQIVNCFLNLGDFITQRTTQAERQTLRVLFLECLLRGVRGNLQDMAKEFVANAGKAGSLIDQKDLYTLCCTLKRIVDDLYNQNPMNVRCTRSTCTPCSSLQNQDINLLDLEATFCCQFELLLEYLVDCVCQNLLPSCSPDPCDDRLILACITVKNDQILRICNFNCRQYAGAFPTIKYWLSIVPILSLIGTAVQNLCCSPDVMTLMTGTVGKFTINENGLKTLQTLGARLDGLLGVLFGGQAAAQAAPAAWSAFGTLDTAALVNESPETVQAALKAAGVTPVVRTMDTPDGEAPENVENPMVARGDRVVLLQAGDKVLGFLRYDPERELDATRVEMEQLKRSLDQIQAQLAARPSGNS